MKKLLYYLILLFTFFPEIKSQDSWQRKADFPTLRYDAIAFSIGEYGYIGTGTTPERCMSDLWRYSQETDTWEELDSIPTQGRQGAYSFVIDNKGYVGGGFSTGMLERFNDLWEFDPATSKWQQKGNPPFKEINLRTTTAFALKGEGYVLATWLENNFWEYDPEIDNWTAKKNFPENEIIAFTGFATSNKGYIVTGFEGTENSKEFWEYNPETDEWLQKTDFPGVSRNEAVAFNIGNKGYVGLGNGGIESGGIINDFWEYNETTGQWAQIADCGMAVQGAVAFSIGNKGYVGTGIFTEVGEFWEYSVTTGVKKTQNENLTNNLFPNPVNDHLTINIAPFPEMKVRIFNIKGVEIKDFKAGHNILDVSDLPEGIYLLSITENGSVVLREKFVKH